MIIHKAKFWFLFLILMGCKSDLSDDPIPFSPFNDIAIDLSFPEFLSLNTNGGYKELNNKGVRGIIIYRLDVKNYLAYERNCSYHPNDACATVNVHSSGLYLTDPCCGSTFNFSNGNPSGGIAWRPLRQYRTQLTGTTLTIMSEIAN
jgi:hypothetical protein